MQRAFDGFKIIPTRFGILLWLIYTINILINSDFNPTFLLNISFIKILVAGKVAKSPAE